MSSSGVKPVTAAAAGLMYSYRSSGLEGEPVDDIRRIFEEPAEPGFVFGQGLLRGS